MKVIFWCNGADFFSTECKGAIFPGENHIDWIHLINGELCIAPSKIPKRITRYGDALFIDGSLRGEIVWQQEAPETESELKESFVERILRAKAEIATVDFLSLAPKLTEATSIIEKALSEVKSSSPDWRAELLKARISAKMGALEWLQAICEERREEFESILLEHAKRMAEILKKGGEQKRHFICTN